MTEEETKKLEQEILILARRLTNEMSGFPTNVCLSACLSSYLHVGMQVVVDSSNSLNAFEMLISNLEIAISSIERAERQYMEQLENSHGNPSRPH